MKINPETQSYLQIISEIAFVLLPIVIILLNLLFTCGLNKSIFLRNDWSFVSLVLFGQSIVKLTTGLIKSKKKFRWQIIGLTITLIIVFLIIPTAMILVLMSNSNSPNQIVITLQFILFVISIFEYFFLGSLGQYYLDEPENINKPINP